MASLNQEPNGRYRILFNAPDGRRLTLRLGDCSRKSAESYKVWTERLIDARDSGRADAEATEWALTRPDHIRDRLTRVGLLAPGLGAAHATLGQLLDEFFKALTIKPATHVRYMQVRTALEGFFGATTPARDIGPLEADRFRQHLKAEGYSDATVAKNVKTSRQVFKMGLRWKMVSENPFADVRAGSEVNKARARFITADDAQKVLDACPCSQTRLLFALSRFGGLRIPSEALGLTWGDVDWDKARIRVTSPKTEGQGKAERWVPLFPELRPHLQAAFDEAPEGSTHVVSLSRDNGKNFRSRFSKIIRRAGLTRWPRLFHNLRASRQTELTARFPAHVVASWMGNSVATAAAHYLQVRDTDFQAAATAPTTDTTTPAPTNPAQNPAQHPTATGRTERQPVTTVAPETSIFQSDSAPCYPVPQSAAPIERSREGSNL